MITVAFFIVAAATLHPVSSDCIYEAAFQTGSLSQSSSQCTSWNEFRSCTADGVYSEVRITSSASTQVYECLDAQVATQICNFIGLDPNTVPSTNFTCNGATWAASQCAVNSMDLTFGTVGCRCTAPEAIASVRPCIGNANWGGVEGTTCSPTSQTLRVECLQTSGGPQPIDCGNCNAAQSTGGCDVPIVETCVCNASPTCCSGVWNPKCAALVETYCSFECIEPPPACTSEPVVLNADPVQGCAGTESFETCTTLGAIQCDANFPVLWGRDPFCFAGEWLSVPRCVAISSGYGHLWFTSLDGNVFAYHRTGVIRMWESAPNDMELQIRTARPASVSCDATLIGQIAFRAGSTLITVVGSEDVFDVRINGVQQPLGGVNTLSLGSGPDELLVEIKETSLSITSKRGAVLNINFYLTSGMSWLTVPHSLDPAAFGGNTRGLLGEYDNNPLNDFTTRDNTILPVTAPLGNNGEQDQFGDSWVLSASESLFGADEDAIAAADPEYSGSPPGSQSIPCPSDFSDESIPECDALPEQLVQACYFDVVLGGDQFLDDVQYAPPCGNNDDQFCSFHGTCENNACVCDNGWSGEDCEIRTCPTECVNSVGSTGGCREDGFCDCQQGFTGQFCEETADCSGVDNCNSEKGQGVCVDTNTCECTSLAFDLPNCSSPPVIDEAVRCGDSRIVSNENLPNVVNQISGDVIFLWDFSEGASQWNITTCSEETDFDTFLSLYADAQLTELIMMQDDFECGTSAALPGDNTDPLPAGVYYVVLEGFANFEGQAEISFTCSA